jgi:hypothetical protein
VRKVVFVPSYAQRPKFPLPIVGPRKSIVPFASRAIGNAAKSVAADPGSVVASTVVPAAVPSLCHSFQPLPSVPVK